MKFNFKLYFVLVIFIFFSNSLISKETWVLDKNLSIINFEVPILIANNVKGKFNEIEGFVEIDLENPKLNQAIFNVKINSIKINYKKYKNLILSQIFFDSLNFPDVVMKANDILYNKQDTLSMNVQLTIKKITKTIPIKIKIIRLANELVQIKSELSFSRKSFKIGTGKWSSSTILKDKILVKVNLFLFKK